MAGFISNTIQLHIAGIAGEDYKFLVLQRSDHLEVYPGLWQVITGTMEEGEKAVDTALREISEETGLTPKMFWTVPYVTVFFDSAKDLIHSSPVFGCLVDINEKILLSPEHQKYLWLNYDECIEKLELPSHKEGTKIFSEYILNGLFWDKLKIELK